MILCIFIKNHGFGMYLGTGFGGHKILENVVYFAHRMLYMYMKIIDFYTENTGFPLVFHHFY